MTYGGSYGIIAQGKFKTGSVSQNGGPKRRPEGFAPSAEATSKPPKTYIPASNGPDSTACSSVRSGSTTGGERGETLNPRKVPGRGEVNEPCGHAGSGWSVKGLLRRELLYRPTLGETLAVTRLREAAAHVKDHAKCGSSPGDAARVTKQNTKILDISKYASGPLTLHYAGGPLDTGKAGLY